MINTKRLRAMIGWLGMVLPWIVVLQLGVIPWSISETASYRETIIPFMIILGSASILLMFYDGYDKVDDIINTIGSIFGLGICLFPCRVDGISKYGHTVFQPPYESVDQLHAEEIGMFNIPMLTSDIIHTVCAIAFFLILAYNSLFQFTKTGNGEMTKNKKRRNIIYRICGIGMIGVFILYPNFVLPYEVCYFKVWLIEMIALTFFGISWLTKANCYKILFAD